MKKSILTVAMTCLTLAGFQKVASAHEDDEQNVQPVYERNVQPVPPLYQQPDYPRYNQDPRSDGHREFDHQSGDSRLGYEVDHLNRMLQHVDRAIRRYPADGHIRSEYRHLRAEAYQLNNQFRRGAQYYDRRRLRAQIAHLHEELHHIEQELHVPANQFYQWR